jgi:hypothetical protein
MKIFGYEITIESIATGKQLSYEGGCAVSAILAEIDLAAELQTHQKLSSTIRIVSAKVVERKAVAGGCWEQQASAA